MANQQESAQQDEHSGKGISIWLEDLRRAHEYLDAGKPFFTGKDCAELADLLESLARSTKAAQQDEREAESVIGVGDGSGNLFVRGPHEAIMRVRSFIFDAEKWRAQQVQADAGAVALLTDGELHELWKIYTVSSYRDGKPAPYALLRAVEQEALDRFAAANSRPAAESGKRDDASHFDNADMMRARRDALEEAAHLVENYEAPRSGATFVEVAASIRAIKRQDRAAMSREQSGGDE